MPNFARILDANRARAEREVDSVLPRVLSCSRLEALKHP